MKEVKLPDLSAIEYELLVEPVSELYRNVAIIRFRGEFRAGPAGAADARMIEACIGFAMTLLGPDALVIDLSALRCAGPLPRHVINPVEPNLEEGFPLYIVSPPDPAALPKLPAQSLCGSVDEAFERIRKTGPWAIR